MTRKELNALTYASLIKLAKDKGLKVKGPGRTQDTIRNELAPIVSRRGYRKSKLSSSTEIPVISSLSSEEVKADVRQKRQYNKIDITPFKKDLTEHGIYIVGKVPSKVVQKIHDIVTQSE